VRFDGTQVQNEIYVTGESPWPVGAAAWEERAAEVLAEGPYGYITGGAGTEATMRANLDAFARRRLRPRMLGGHTERTLAVDVLGTHSPFPFLLAPVGVLSIADRDGELAPARAAAAAGVPFILSTAASHSIEEIAEAMGDAPRWFQLYWVSDPEVVESLVRRAEAAAYSAIVVTLDTLVLGWRPRDLRNAYLPFRDGEGIAQFTSDPVFRSRLSVAPEDDPLVAAGTMLAMFSNLALRWEDLAWLRELTSLPLLVKGVLTAEDAQRALDAGVDGIIVSNHGGRQVDGAVASLDALLEVRAATGSDAVLLVDGGVRGGADVVKALAIGANAVLIGRPYVYALAVGGEAGVAAVLQQLAAETDLTLALMGAGSVDELDSTWIAASS
jgi:lactate 2-monooxygenase